MAGRIFYGWWMVAACLLIAVFSWGLGVFGIGVYLHAIAELHGWSVGSISSAITVSVLLSSVASAITGPAVGKYGPRPIIALGALLIASGVFFIGQVREPWHVFAAFSLSGLGFSCISVTTLSATLSPWFERHQGRAISTAMLGASIGGMTSTPLLIFAISRLGLEQAMMWSAAVALIVILPLAIFVLRKSPADMGLHPDGEPPAPKSDDKPVRVWSRSEALRTTAFVSVVIAFALGLGVQMGFLTHHVTLAVPALGAAGAAFIVSITAVAAFLGRVALARWADHVDLRITTAAVLFVAALSLGAIAAVPAAWMLITASLAYGLTTGNVTTLSPIIVRQEFGAGVFASIYGVCWMCIGFASALGPAMFGWLHDYFGGYREALMLAAVLDLIAAAVVYLGRPERAVS
ncbi:MAG: MFS transporter [Xanthobacteraceae bacterium]|jgi:MFS family permease